MNIHDAAYIMHGILNTEGAECTREQQEEEELWRWQQQQECEERELWESKGFVRPEKERKVLSEGSQG
mgnify:CR=1 FL=1